MKKLIVGLVILGLLTGALWPVVVSADYPSEQCERCCYLYNATKYYDVSRSVNGAWVTNRIAAWTAREAAEKFDLRAGYDCFVGYVGTDFEPILKSYEVSYREDGNWVTKSIEAESAEAAAKSFGLEAGVDCFVNRVI